MTHPRVVFLDTETTGLNPDVGHVIWELAMIEATLDMKEKALHIKDTLHVDIQLSPDEISAADPMALKIGGYYRRRDSVGNLYHGQKDVRLTGTEERQYVERVAPEDAASMLAYRIADSHIVGAVPSFDERFMRQLLWANGHVGTWHYHLIDIEPLMIGRLLALATEMGSTKFEVDAKGTIKEYTDIVGLPYKSKELAWACGVTIPEEDMHTALQDAEWAMRCFAEVYDVSIEEDLDE